MDRPASGRTVVWSGPVYDGIEVFDGFVEHDGACILQVDEGKPPRAPDATGLILPAPVNAHTHVGDTALRGRVPVPASLAQAVAPPEGVKHRALVQEPASRLAAGIVAGLGEAAASGTLALGDFREGGWDGLDALDDAARQVPSVAVFAFARAAKAEPDSDELDALLERAAGLGLSGLADVPGRVRDEYAAACRRAGKPLALHYAEAAPEDVHEALALEPAFVVHACHAGRKDLRALGDAGVGLVVCPRSNARFGLRAPVEKALECGVGFALGTDNGWFHPLDIWSEIAFLLQERPTLPPEAVLAFACGNGRKVLNIDGPLPFVQKGRDARLALLACPSRTDIGAALRAPRVLAVVQR